MEGHVLSPAVSFQRTRRERGTEGSATSCTLVQSAWLWASRECHQWPRGEAHGSWVPSRAGFGHKSQDPVKLLEGERRRRKRGIIPPPLCCAGPQPSDGCRHWASGTVAFHGLWLWFNQCLDPAQLVHLTHPPGKNREHAGQEQVGKEDDPATNTPCEDAHPQLCLRICWRPHPSQLCRTCQPAQTLPCCSTETRD